MTTEAPPVEKVKYPRTIAMAVARELCRHLTPRCEQIIVAGSLRRRKQEVGDVEILFIPKRAKIADPSDMLGHQIEVDDSERAIGELVQCGVIEKRLNVKGREAWGEDNKLARHVATGVPVDLFTATRSNWFNYLVCRTGGTKSSIAICEAAIERGWKWNPYGEGFTRKPSGAGPNYHDVKAVHSEREVFEFVGLDYKEPWER